MIAGILKLFKGKYNAKDYGIVERDFPALCVYIGGQRHKVVDIYRTADEQSYFVVYKKTPIEERRPSRFADGQEIGYFHGAVNF